MIAVKGLEASEKEVLVDGWLLHIARRWGSGKLRIDGVMYLSPLRKPCGRVFKYPALGTYGVCVDWVGRPWENSLDDGERGWWRYIDRSCIYVTATGLG